MAYRALYRQWRPKDFSHMVGQRAIIETLRNQVVSDRIAHAYLFCGSRGTGKTSTAKILARAINCEHPENGDPCGKCPNCIRMENEESLDIIEIDAASNNGVDEMRDLRETVKYPPQYGKYKVYIIDEVHMLSTSAFNALLKTLEEPPAHIVFILATTEPQKLPETILSRCQRFDFGRIAVSDIQGRLKEAAEGSGAKVTPGALMVIARAAEGGMRDALSILDMCLGYGNEIDEDMVRGILGTCDQGFLFRFANALATENTRELFGMIDQVMRNGRDPSVFIKDISYHIRTLLLAKCCPEEIGEILDLTDEDADEFRNQAEDFTVTRLMTILELTMNAESEMRFSSSQRLTLENVCLKCCLRTGESDAQALSDRIAELEKKIEELNERIARGFRRRPRAGFGWSGGCRDSGSFSAGKENGSGEKGNRHGGETRGGGRAGGMERSHEPAVEGRPADLGAADAGKDRLRGERNPVDPVEGRGCRILHCPAEPGREEGGDPEHTESGDGYGLRLFRRSTRGRGEPTGGEQFRAGIYQPALRDLRERTGGYR